MAKKKHLSEFAQQKRAKNKKQLNPFEIHTNKEKQKVLGRVDKNDRGLPGISRAKAVNRRKKSLLQEYKIKNKDNVFLDKRILVKNSMEDETIARFAVNLRKTHKKSIYNLDSDNVGYELTHSGQTLEEIEKFDDPRSDDEFSDEENKGQLDKNFVEGAHFGEPFLSKTSSRQDLIDKFIAESKKRKAEKQKVREQTIDLTEKLDSEWKDLLPLMSASKKSGENVVEMTKADAYDMAVRELKFEARGNPSEKLKSEEEIIQEEKERLEALEADRLARMKGLVSGTNNKLKHRSADDLDDDFSVETIVEDDADNDNNSMASNDDSNEEDTDVDNDEISDDNSDKNRKTMLENTAEKNSENSTKDNKDVNRNQDRTCSKSSNVEDKSDVESNSKNAADGDSDNENSEDNFSDLKESESSDEDESKVTKKHVMFSNNLTEDTKQTKQSNVVHPKSILKQNEVATCTSEQSSSEKDKQQEIRKDLLKRKEIMEEARKELPYTYNIPVNFEELEKLLENHNSEYQSIIIDRIIKCNHWTLDGKNKEKLSNLFIYLLQHIHDCASTDDADNLVRCFQVFDR